MWNAGLVMAVVYNPKSWNRLYIRIWMSSVKLSYGCVYRVLRTHTTI